MLKCVGMFCLSWLPPLSRFIVLPSHGVLWEPQGFLDFFGAGSAGALGVFGLFSGSVGARL